MDKNLFVVYGDRGYRGCEGVIVCDSKDMRAKRQVVEGVISQIKLFNAGSGCSSSDKQSIDLWYRSFWSLRYGCGL